MGGQGSGRSPTSEAIKRLTGSRRESPAAPAFPAGCPKPPTWMSAVGKREFKRLSALLENAGVLTQVDLGVLAGYCEAWADVQAATKVVNDEGAVCEGAMGGLYQHPAIGIRNKAWERLRTFGRELGLSPAARTRLDVKPTEESDPLAEYLLEITRAKRSLGAMDN